DAAVVDSAWRGCSGCRSATCAPHESWRCGDARHADGGATRTPGGCLRNAVRQTVPGVHDRAPRGSAGDGGRTFRHGRRRRGNRDLPPGVGRGRRPASRDQATAHATRGACETLMPLDGSTENAGFTPDPDTDMRIDLMASRSLGRAATLLTPLFAAAFSISCASGAGGQAGAGAGDAPRPSAESSVGDPREGLDAGWMDAEEAARNLELVAHVPRPDGFVNPQRPGDFGYANSDMAFRDELVFVGNFNGFQIYDISDPSEPSLRTAFVCPGGQGDLSVHGDLLFMS